MHWRFHITLWHRGPSKKHHLSIPYYSLSIVILKYIYIYVILKKNNFDLERVWKALDGKIFMDGLFHKSLWAVDVVLRITLLYTWYLVDDNRLLCRYVSCYSPITRLVYHRLFKFEEKIQFLIAVTAFIINVLKMKFKDVWILKYLSHIL